MAQAPTKAELLAKKLERLGNMELVDASELPKSPSQETPKEPAAAVMVHPPAPSPPPAPSVSAPSAPQPPPPREYTCLRCGKAGGKPVLCGYCGTQPGLPNPNARVLGLIANGPEGVSKPAWERAVMAMIRTCQNSHMPSYLMQHIDTHAPVLRAVVVAVSEQG